MAVTGGGTGPDLDLTPLPGREGPKRRRLRGPIVLVGVLAALAVVVTMGLRDATVYFRNVDEAVAQRPDLGSSTFRMQGNVVDGSIRQTDDGVGFTMKYHGVTAPVVHVGSEPALFGKPDIPVVVEGYWDDEVFRSERIITKHDNSYEEDNPDRIRDAESDATSPDAATPDAATPDAATSDSTVGSSPAPPQGTGTP